MDDRQYLIKCLLDVGHCAKHWEYKYKQNFSLKDNPCSQEAYILVGRKKTTCLRVLKMWTLWKWRRYQRGTEEETWSGISWTGWV